MSGLFSLHVESKNQTCQQYSWKPFLSVCRQDFVHPFGGTEDSTSLRSRHASHGRLAGGRVKAADRPPKGMALMRPAGGRRVRGGSGRCLSLSLLSTPTQIAPKGLMRVNTTPAGGNPSPWNPLWLASPIGGEA